MKVKFEKFNRKTDFITNTKHPGIYICTLGVFTGYIGISENVACRWFSQRENHNSHPHNKWVPGTLTGFSNDALPFKRKVSKKTKKMDLYAACGNGSVKGKTKRGRKILNLHELELRAGIESLIIYKQSQVNKSMDTTRNPLWGRDGRTNLTRNNMLLNKNHIYSGEPKGPDQGEMKPREYMKKYFSNSCIEIEGLPLARCREMTIQNVGTAVDAYHQGNRIP